MPSHETLLNGMLRIEELPLELIAPQHGSILRKPLIGPIINELKGLECGLFLLSYHDSRVERLLKLGETLRAMLRALHLERGLRAIASELLRLVQGVVPAQTLEFLVRDGESYLLLAPENRYRGVKTTPPPILIEQFEPGRTIDDKGVDVIRIASEKLALPLYTSDTFCVVGFALLEFPSDVTIDAELVRVLQRVAVPLGVAVERDSLLRQTERERDSIAALAILDPLTGLHTRRHMSDVATRLVALHDRDARASFAVIIFDIDHFKQVNDAYGHLAGDAALKHVATLLRSTLRVSDITIRYGGDELVVLADVSNLDEALVIAERVRSSVERTGITIGANVLNLSISAGVALREQKEPFDDCLARADAALYHARRSGRSRVCFESET